jgi:hypothetical protein
MMPRKCGFVMRKKRGCAVVGPVSPREFIKAWQESNSVAEVAQKVRAKKNAVRVRAFRYRQLGIPLKEFPPVEYEPTDWGQLAQYAEDLLDEQPDAEADEQGEGEEPA